MDYSDSLTEKEFLKAVEEGNLDEVSETKKRKRASVSGKGGKGGKSKYTNDDSLNDDADDLNADADTTNEAIDVKPPVKRKRGRPAASASNTPSSKSAGRPSSGASNSPSSAKLALQMRTLIDCLLNYSDRSGRVLSEPFLQLPTRRELPDYYEIIKRPIDLKKFVFLLLHRFYYNTTEILIMIYKKIGFSRK